MGINLNSSFTPNAALPLDDRTVFADAAARDAVPAGRLYAGLMCYVEDVQLNYQYDGSAWVEFESGGGSGSGTGSLDTLFQTDFETDPVFDSLGTGWAILPTTQINGENALVFDHSGSTSSYKTLAIAPKFRGKVFKVILDVATNATAGNLNFWLYDETTPGPDLGYYELVSGRNEFRFTMPSNCLSMSFGFDGMVEALASSYIDDLVIQIVEEHNKFGNGTTSADPYIEADVGEGVNNPKMIYDQVTGKWRVVNVEGDSIEIGAIPDETDVVFKDDFDNSKLTDYSITTVMSLVGPVLHGTKSATVGHDTVSTYEFKREYSVDSKFRGRNATIISDILSSASTDGLVLLTVTDETNAVVLLDQETLTYDGSTVTQNRASFDIPSDCFDISYHFEFLPDASGGVTTIDDVVCVLSDSLVNETALIQEEDTVLYAAGNAGQVVATDGSIPFTPSTIQGGAVSFDGTTVTILESGTFNVTVSANFTTSAQRSLMLNGSTSDYRISPINVNTATISTLTGSGAFYFEAGETFTISSGINGGTLSNSTVSHFLTVTKQGTLRQVNVNSNQKIKIPTSEVRFEGASSLGTGAESTTVQFTSQTELKGSAFTVDNSNGTVVTVTKAGRLTASFSLFANVSAYFYVAKNGTNLRGMGIGNTDGLLRTVTWEGDVAVNDEIKITSSGSAPVSNSANNFSVHHQELEVQVSVSNTLPQYAEDDLVVKAAGNSGQVMTVDVTDIPFITVSDTTGGAWSGSQFTVQEDGVHTFSGGVNFTSAAASKYIAMYVDGTQYKTVTPATASTFYTFSVTENFTAGQVISFRVGSNGATLFNSASHALSITKVGKPNVTGVDVTSFVDIPRIERQSNRLTSTSNVTTTTDLDGLTKLNSKGSGIYTLGTTGIRMLKAAKLDISAVGGTSSNTLVTCYMQLNGGDYIAMDLARHSSVNSLYAGSSTSIEVNAGDLITFTIANSTLTYINIVATAESDQIVTSLESFSTDSNALAYSSSYSLATLSTALVGTYITGTFTAGTNTRVQSTGTNRPTQTDADMNTNGILISTRAYAAAGATATPSWFAIQIGKGLKGVSIGLYKSAAKTTSGELGFSVSGSTGQGGLYFKSYDEKTGVLLVDAGTCTSTGITSNVLYYTDGTNATSGYLVIHASKNPAFTGVSKATHPYALYTSDSGQAISTSVTAFKYEDKVIDTHNAYNTGSGIYTVPETGYYQIDASFLTASVTLTTASSVSMAVWVDGGIFRTRRVNGTGAANFYPVTYSETIYFTKGQTILINSQSSVATTGHTSSQFNSFSIKRVQ